MLTAPVAGAGLLSAHLFSRLTEERGYTFQNEKTKASKRQKQAAGKRQAHRVAEVALKAGAVSIYLPMAYQPHSVGTAETGVIPQTT